MASTSGAGSPRQAAAQRGPTRREPSSKPPKCRGCSSTLATADSTYPRRSRLPRDGRGGACVGVGRCRGRGGDGARGATQDGAQRGNREPHVTDERADHGQERAVGKDNSEAGVWVHGIRTDAGGRASSQ
jgi:hypothetical protein